MKLLPLSFTITGSLLAMSACAGPSRVSPRSLELPDIKSITVTPFQGAGGSEVFNEFVRVLVSRGMEVTDAAHAGPIVLKGTVIEYRSNNAQMVFLGKTTLVTPSGQTVTVTNPVVSASAMQFTQQESQMSPRSQVASVNAVVGVTATLTDSSTGRVLWAGRLTYEALDLPCAVQSVARLLTDSMAQILPHARQKSS